MITLSAASLVAFAVVVLIGATTQRVTGMGFGLVAAPFLSLILGPRAAVPLILALAIVASVAVIARTFRDIQWGRALLLSGPAVLGMIPAAWLVTQLSAPILSIIVGTMVLIALALTVGSSKFRVFTGWKGASAAGFFSGVGAILAGIGGPQIVLYKVSTNWEHKYFVATVQIYFIILNVVAISLLRLPALPAEGWVAGAAMMILGLVIGEWLHARVRTDVVSKLVIGVALAGAASTFVSGLVSVLT